MIQLNYPEMLQDIKMSIFSGDHSGIYSLACAVACIAASFSLITWYNKMMNDPFGRLDVRSVVRTVFVLFLTCNFYSFVLMPLDGITHTVAKAITASVDSDRDGVFGKINELYAAVEEHDKETLTGQFEEEMGRESSSTDLDGLSYETSAIAESIVESAIEKGEKPGFFKRLWSGVKGFVSAKIGQAVNNLGSILSALLSIIVKLVQYVLYAVSSVYLILCGYGQYQNQGRHGECDVECGLYRAFRISHPPDCLRCGDAGVPAGRSQPGFVGDYQCRRIGREP